MADHSESKLLHDILAALRSIRDEIHSIAEKQKTAKEKHKDEPLRVSIGEGSSLPVTVREHYESEKSENRWNRWKKFRVALEVIGFVGAVIAAVYTVRTFNQIKRQTDIAHTQWQDLRHNLEVDQRAWMKITCPLPTKLTDLLSTKTETRNVGKSVATVVTFYARMAVVDKGLPPPFAQSENAKSFKAHIGPLFPNDPEVFQVSDIAKISEFELTGAQTGSLKSGKSYIAVYGGVVYVDQFGSHWTRFCDWMAYSKESSYNADGCISFNTVGEGPIIPQK